MNTWTLRSSDYWSVLDTRTGRKLADCGTEEDAWSLVAFDRSNRTVTRSKHLAGPVVDVSVQGVLPTSAVTVTAGSPGSVPRVFVPGGVSLPAGQGDPVVV